MTEEDRSGVFGVEDVDGGIDEVGEPTSGVEVGVGVEEEGTEGGKVVSWPVG